MAKSFSTNNLPRMNTSIAVVVIVTLVTVSTIVLGAFGIYNYSRDKEYRWTKLRMEIQVNADQLATGLALPVWNIDRDQIDKVIESAMNDRNIMGIVVTAAGRTHIRARNSDWHVISATLPFPTEGLEQENREVRFAGEQIGEVHLYVTTRFIEHEIDSTLISSVVVIVAFDLLLTLALYFLLWRIVLRPLKEVETFAANVSSGKQAKMGESSTRFGGELANVKASIEKMVLLLDSRYVALEDVARAHREAEEEIRISHDRLRALTERLTTIREDEKTKLAHEIHDEFGQVLSAMKMDLAFMARKLQPTDFTPFPDYQKYCAPLLARVDAMSSTIDSTIVKIRQIAIDLRPDLLDNLGLVEAINWYAEEFSKRSGLQCRSVISDPTLTVPPELGIALFRITQEALTNVVRHAEATEVMITMIREGDGLLLTIRDNGKGIHPEDMVKPTSMGVLGMRERVLAFNGECVITGRAAGGTTVTIRIPHLTAKKTELV